ncbi:MAG: AraC family ligand binding domain-containing protein [Oscillospiraceae bacterium]
MCATTISSTTLFPGRDTWRCSGGTAPFGPILCGAGQGFLICPNQVTTYCADEKDPWAYTWVEFGGVRPSTG